MKQSESFEKVRIVLAILGTYLLFMVGNRLGALLLDADMQGLDILKSINYALGNLLPSFFSFPYGLLPSFRLIPMLLGFICVTGVIIGILYGFDKRKNKAVEQEHGSARFGKIEEEAGPLQNTEDPQYAIIYSEHIAVSMDTRKTFLNNNTLTIGGSGSGKTRFHVKPDVLNMACNYIITDPKDSLIKEIGTAFLKEGYDMKYLNLVDFASSMHYNPFKYIYKPNDILKYVNNLIASTTKSAKSAGGDEFFEKSEIAMMTAIIFYIFAVTENSPAERNMNEVMDLIDMAEASEEDENMVSDLDLLFQELEYELEEKIKNRIITQRQAKNTYAYLAQRQYSLYKKAAGKTAKSILISIGVRMAVFNLPELNELLSYDELDLETIGNPKPQPKYREDKGHEQVCDPKYGLLYLDENNQDCYQTLENGNVKFRSVKDGKEIKPKLQKTVLFVAISDSDSTFNFLAAIIYQQLFDLLYRQADATEKGRLPIHTRFVLDEFANTGKITDFEIKIATMRSREISVDVILQNLAQLKNAYKDSWETIEGNCDVTLFLGGKEYSTLERLSKIIGNTTINYLSVTENRGGANNGSWSQNVQLISRPLMAPDEIGRLKTDECLVHIRGQHIFKDKKYPLMDHKNIKWTEDGDPKNRFDTAKIKEYFGTANNYASEEEPIMEFEEVEGDTRLLSANGVYLGIPADQYNDLNRFFEQFN